MLKIGNPIFNFSEKFRSSFFVLVASEGSNVANDAQAFRAQCGVE